MIILKALALFAFLGFMYGLYEICGDEESDTASIIEIPILFAGIFGSIGIVIGMVSFLVYNVLSIPWFG